MAELKKYDLAGKNIGKVTVDSKLLKKELKSQMIKDYIVALRQNARQWSASTKERADVAHSRKKPHPQKGTGRARQGCTAAAQYKGGGIVFGPKPKFDQNIRVNRKEKRAVLSQLISEKIGKDAVSVISSEGLDKPQTKKMAALLRTLEMEGKRVLYLGSAENTTSATLVQSMRNLPKTQFMPAGSMSGYDLILSDYILVDDSAVDELIEVLRRAS